MSPPYLFTWEVSKRATANRTFHAYVVDQVSGKKIAAVWGSVEDKPLFTALLVHAPDMMTLVGQLAIDGNKQAQELLDSMTAMEAELKKRLEPA